MPNANPNHKSIEPLKEMESKKEFIKILFLCRLKALAVPLAQIYHQDKSVLMTVNIGTNSQVNFVQ